jgi:hypothetical protein
LARSGGALQCAVAAVETRSTDETGGKPMRMILIALLIAIGIGLTGTSSPTAAPANGVVIGEAAGSAAVLSDVGYVRRRGRVCYAKCYNEFFFLGRRICRAYC